MDRTSHAWDLFISHASEDKENFVEPLASALREFGLNVWYDDYVLTPGDSLTRSIDKGLAQCRYGLVVLSPSFFAKKWPGYELSGLAARDVEEGKVILPVWHGVSKRDVLKFSPPLADKLAIVADGKTPLQVAIEIIQCVRPDIFENIQRRTAYQLIRQSATPVRVKIEELDNTAPIRHAKLPPDLVARIRLIRAALLDVYPGSMAFWLDGFKRDAHPSDEILIWEHIAAVYREYVALQSDLTKDQREAAFHVAFGFSVGADLETKATQLPDGALEQMREMYAYSVPIYDFGDSQETETDVVSAPEDEDIDKESFPDIPNHLIRRFINE